MVSSGAASPQFREAPRSRPEPHLVLLSLAGHVRARPAEVFRAIALRAVPQVGRSGAIVADDRAHLVIVHHGVWRRGAWRRSGWMRGEYRVVPDDNGCHIEYSMLSLARPSGLAWRPLLRRNIRIASERAPIEFQRVLRQLRLELE